MYGHLEILKWLRAQDPPCPWDNTTCYFAAKRGHLEILKWIHVNGCPCSDSSLCKEYKIGNYANDI